jgi:hypothetical protein
MKRFVSLWIAAFVMIGLVGSVFALPVAKIKPVGISPRGVAADANDIYTAATTGLGNVGVGEKMYLIGNEGDTTITAWEWTISARPANSQAALSAGDTPVVMLRSDLAGTYTITLRVTNPTGQSDPVTYKVNAANYVGVGGIVGEADAPECAGCHGEGAEVDVVSEWANTKHATMLSRNYNGADGTAYRAVCISCHTVGYNTDTLAVNQGFDDMARAEGWVFRDSAAGGLRAGAWEDMMERFPNTARKGNIQCESCHGPGSRHNGATADNKIAKSLDAAVCAKCHDSGTHHVFPDQWKKSGHSHQEEESRVGCANCHSGRAFIQTVSNPRMADSLKAYREYVPIGCAVCHDSHSDANPYQIRTVAPYMLLDSTVVDFGLGNLCVNCHHARRNAPIYVLGRPTSTFGPHYSNQGDMLAGTNAIEYGRQMRSAPHGEVIENGCVGCHMAETPAQGPGLNNVGAHTFQMAGNGYENTEVCAPCHGEIESFEDFQASGDWDHDGTNETVHLELQGLMDTVTGMLPRGALAPDTTYSLAQKQAFYNWKFVSEDGSRGMHNAYYARDILQAAIDGLPVGRTLRVNLQRGWNTMSINIIPARNMWVGNQGADIRRMLTQLRIDANNHHVQAFKNDMGEFYLPAFDFNNIAYWSLIDGYQIKVDADVTVEWTGEAINPAANIALTEGWNTVPYYPTYLLSADAPDLVVVSSIRDNLIVAKDDQGRFMLPEFGFSNMHPWAKGKGYQIKVDAACNLSYPGEQARRSEIEPLVSRYWLAPVSTGSSMSVLVTDIGAPDGSQICAVNGAGEIVGAGTIQNGRCGLAVWGDDQSTDAIDGMIDGEKFSLKIWNIESGAEVGLGLEVVRGSGLTYKTDDIAVGKAVAAGSVPSDYYLGKNYPNPFNSTTRIAFGLPEAGMVSVKVFDLAGREIATLVDGNMNAGNHIVVWTADSVPAGVYLVKMEAGSFADTRKVTFLK